MRISELAGRLALELAQETFEDRAISGGYSSDLLSDVMANAAADAVLVTIQAHKNTIAVASLLGLAAVVICNSRSLPEDMIRAAAAEGIAIFTTGMTQFEISGRLWSALRGDERGS
jgi:hypothetical protein